MTTIRYAVIKSTIDEWNELMTSKGGTYLTATLYFKNGDFDGEDTIEPVECDVRTSIEKGNNSTFIFDSAMLGALAFNANDVLTKTENGDNIPTDAIFIDGSTKIVTRLRLYANG